MFNLKSVLSAVILFLVLLSCVNNKSKENNVSGDPVSADLPLIAIDDITDIQEETEKYTYKSNYDSLRIADSLFFGKAIWVGNRYEVNEHAVYDVLPHLSTEDIDKSEFDKAVSQYKTKVINDSSKIKVDKNTFTYRFNTAKGEKKFFYDRWKDCECSYPRDISYIDYVGYIPDLKLYLFEDWSVGEFMIGEMFMVDSLTNIKYQVISLGDGPMNLPVVSPDNKHMLIYTSDSMVADWSLVYVIQIDKSSPKSVYKDMAGVKLSGFEVRNVVWCDNSSFVLHLVKNNDEAQWEDVHLYKKATLPE